LSWRLHVRVFAIRMLSLLIPSSALSSIPSLAFFFTAAATSELYTLSLHDALPISASHREIALLTRQSPGREAYPGDIFYVHARRSEEHTSELQSHLNLVCRLLLEKKKKLE